MSITLDLSPELEARMRADAERQRLPLEEIVVAKLHDFYTTTLEERERLAALERLDGALSGTGLELEEFLNERHADVERENSRDGY